MSLSIDPPQRSECKVLMAPLIPIVIVSICDGTGLPLLCTILALDWLTEVYGVTFTIQGTIIFEKDPNCRSLCRQLLQTFEYPGPVVMYEDVSKIMSWAIRFILPSTWYMLVIGGTPCRAHRKRDYGIHAPPSNLWWPVYSAINHFQARCGH